MKIRSTLLPIHSDTGRSTPFHSHRFPSLLQSALLSRSKSILAASLTVLICRVTLAQVDTLAQSADDMFATARQKAFSGERQEARKLCTIILARNPSYIDARVLMGRTYAWDGRYDSARAELSRALAKRPTYKDALDALTDVELWDHRYVEAIEIADRGLRSYPNEKSLLLKKARALKNLGRNDEALTILDRLEQIDPSGAGVSSLLRELNMTAHRNGVAVRYSTDRFSAKYDPMHYADFQVSRWTKYGSIFGRLNYARRFQSDGLQPEIDWYPSIAEGVYGYLNYGFSASDLFPKHRAGAELYSSLPWNFEGSAGFRHLYFSASRHITIYTGSLGLYFGSYWLALRPYLTSDKAGFSKSLSFNLRRYFGDGDNFLLLRGGVGFAVDERAMQSSAGFGGTEVFYLKAQTVGLGWQGSLGINYLLFATVDITRQELGVPPGTYVTMYSLSIELRARF
jgi:YaiO family outer membrane protein